MTQAVLNYIREYKLEPFPADNRSEYHNIVSLVISQRIPFRSSRMIRARIYQVLGTSSLDGIMTLTHEQRISCGLTDDKWQRIVAFDTNGIDARGIGPWTRACAKLMRGDYSCGFITTDASVNALVRRIAGCESSNLHFASAADGGRAFSALWNSVRSK